MFLKKMFDKKEKWIHVLGKLEYYKKRFDIFD